jgi:P2 family phage contractile tail tube protein
MNGPLKADFGHEAMEMEISSAEIDGNLIKTWGTADLQGVGLRFRAALEREGSDPAVEGIEIVARGRFAEIDLGTPKSGEKHMAKYKLELAYLKITDNGNDLVEIDTLNMVEKVGGTDILSAQREALGL